MNNNGLKINRLILVGHRKNYEIPFYPGVNIIYGDADTGKSSILNIVYYLLGGKSIQVDFEIESSVIYPVLEVKINNNPYCIKRDLYDYNRMVEVYSCVFEDVNNNYPEKYIPSYNSGENNNYFSEFLLNELNYPVVKLKQSPSKEDSKMARLSIRDLFKYCYLDQDDVGSKTMLNIGNHAVEVKNREVFKYIFNVLDTNLSDVESEISEKLREKNELDQQFKIISRFLQDTEFQSIDKIDEEITNIEEEKEVLDEQLKNINSRTIADSELYNGIREALDTIVLKIIEQESIKDNSVKNIERFGRLKNDYVNDIEKLRSIETAGEIIGKENVITAPCPICDSNMDVSQISSVFSVSSSDKISQESNAIKRRIKDLSKLIDENRNEITKCSTILDELYSEKEKAKLYLDEEMSKSISPYLAERDGIISEMASLSERRDKYRHILKVRNQHNKISDKIGKMESDLILLREKLERLRLNSPSIDNVLVSLGDYLESYLQKIHIKNNKNISISEKTFLPVVRNIEYRNINSGGLRTIVSIGFMAAILRARLNYDINLPNLLMVDTVGKYLGKTKDKYKNETDENEDSTEGMSDPEKYANLYIYLIQLAEEFEENGKLCQIFLVDNDVPSEIAEKHKGFVVAHYSSEGINGLPVGLIDDWDEVREQ